MTWSRFDDNFPNHPKLARLGYLQLPAVGLHVLAICWCNAYLTDGHVPAPQVVKLAGDLDMLLPSGDVEEIIAALKDVGMWHAKGDGYDIHDFLDYQPSKKQVMAERAAKVAAGKAGGIAAAKARAEASAVAESKPVPTPVPVPVARIHTNSRPATAKAAAPERARVLAFQLYEQTIGTIDAHLAQKVQEALDDGWTDECQVHCFAEASEHNARNWKYVDAIRKRHKAEGCFASVPTNGTMPPTDPEAEWLAERYRRGKDAAKAGA